MWIVAKIKNNNSEIFKNDFSKKILKRDIIFYEPKYTCRIYSKGKKIERTKSLLENYIFVNTSIFQILIKILLNSLKDFSFFLKVICILKKI